MKTITFTLYLFIFCLSKPSQVYPQGNQFKVKIGSISYDDFNSILAPNAAFVLIKTEFKDLKVTSNTNGIIKELPSFDFSNNRIFAIHPEKQKFIIKKNGYKELKIIIPKLFTTQRIEFIIK